MSDVSNQRASAESSFPVTSDNPLNNRAEVFVMLIIQGLYPGKGSMIRLAKDLSTYTGRNISRQMVSMALTGYRTTDASKALITETKNYLKERALTAGQYLRVHIHNVTS